jgi:SAM-dependent methyltransferase
MQGAAEHLPTALVRNSFDVVHMSHVLEHCIDPRKALAEARSLLAPNGTLVIEVPNNEDADFGPTWPWADVPRHLNFFTRQSLTGLLASEGLRVTATHFVGFSRHYHPRWWQMQSDISGVIGGPKPIKRWIDLIASLLRQQRSCYDSVRVHASTVDSTP